MAGSWAHGRRLRALAFWCLAEFTTDLARPQPRAPVRLLQKKVYIYTYLCVIYIVIYWVTCSAFSGGYMLMDLVPG